MGGMGTIHGDNDSIIFEENSTMTRNVLFASIAAGVGKLFYASSACVYPEPLQADSLVDVSLKESDAWSHIPPRPQGLYGLEKLLSEALIQQHSSHIEVRIARFHNIFGPRGAWSNGREKVPAAFIRKALAAKLLLPSPATMEIWGDGTQRRSFLFIDDCVRAILSLLDSTCSSPMNIGSEDSVSMTGLAELAIQSAGLQVQDVDFHHILDRPIGVASRNSNNAFARRIIGWEPQTRLLDGIRATMQWMRAEMEHALEGLDNSQRTAVLQHYQTSKVVRMDSEWITFAILLPITSRGSENPQTCLDNLSNFAKSLSRTTWRETHELGGTRFRVKIYLAIDHDDEFLVGTIEEAYNRAAEVLHGEGLADITTLLFDFPRGHVCSLWRECARRAFADHCDYYVLMGDDVALDDDGWMTAIVAEFSKMASKESVPEGFGCVSLTDTSFPGMPTFPTVHRTHMEIFDGTIVPEAFVNQDGDPFLFQLYRRWGCSSMISARIRNTVGGSDTARYIKQHTKGWTFDTLDDATATIAEWLQTRAPDAQKKLTLDIVIPCYRVDIPVLEGILSLQSSTTSSVMFIIIIDDPSSPSIYELENRFGKNPLVRIRVNAENLGASASRNRGMAEAAGEWIFFLDDDVSPSPDLLIKTEEIIRYKPNAIGFVGKTIFPLAQSVFTTAVHLAGVTYFWDIAAPHKAVSMGMEDDIPWGVTASLISRRIKDDVVYDLQFPKTGGGEDIHFYRQKREVALAREMDAFQAAPDVVVTHPWWKGGKRSYWRFYMWSKGDGGLIRLYPEHTYFDAAPNSAEFLLLSGLIFILGCLTMNISVTLYGVRLAIMVVLANVVHDAYRHLFSPEGIKRATAIQTNLTGSRWVIAVLESALIRMFSESGRTVGMMERGEVTMLGRRFDWFTEKLGDGPRREERWNSAVRLVVIGVFMVASMLIL